LNLRSPIQVVMTTRACRTGQTNEGLFFSIGKSSSVRTRWQSALRMGCVGLWQTLPLCDGMMMRSVGTRRVVQRTSDSHVLHL